MLVYTTIKIIYDRRMKYCIPTTEWIIITFIHNIMARNKNAGCYGMQNKHTSVSKFLHLLHMNSLNIIPILIELLLHND